MSTHDPASDEGLLSNLLTTLNIYTSNFTTNISTSISALTVKDYIRLVWIIGGYLFLRPYLDKGFAKLLNSASRKQEEKKKAAAAATAAAAAGGDVVAGRKHRRELKRARMELNAIREMNGEKVEEMEEEDDVDVDDDEESESGEEAEAQASGVPSWGKSARRRQKNYFKHIEREAERLKEADDDKDIEHLLED